MRSCIFQKFKELEKSDQPSDLVDRERHQPCQGRGVDRGEYGPFPASRFLPDGRQRGDAREVDQHEEHVAVGHEGRDGDAFRQVDVLHVVLVGVEHAQGADHELFRTYAREDADAHLPVEAQRLDGRFDGLAQTADVGILLLFGGGGVVLMIRVVAQEPDDDGRDHDDASHLLEILFSFFPRVARHDLGRRHAVGGELHHEGTVVALHDEFGEHAGHEHGQQDADGVDGQQHQTGPGGEERPDEHQVDGQARAARHQRIDEHGDQTRLAALDDA